MKHLAWLVCLVLLAPIVCAQTTEEKKQTVAYLQSLQTPEGGFLGAVPREGKGGKPSLRATSSALRALKYMGGAPRDAETCMKFVASCCDRESGGFADSPGRKTDVTSTAVGMMAVAELNMPLNEYRDGVVKYLVDNAKTFEEIRIAAAGVEAARQRPKAADAWVEQVTALRNKDGIFGEDDGQARETGSALVVLLRLGGKVSKVEKVQKVLLDGQRKDGGFGKAGTEGSDLETSYRVMRALHMLNEKPRNVIAMKSFIGKCRNEDGGYGVVPGEPSSASGTYFASIILSWLAK
jgi:prenyltransferase beta subunit